MAEEGWMKATKDEAVKEGVPLAVEVSETKVLLVRRNGRIHACGGTCSHYGGPLDEGLLHGNEITCPWHNARFDVTSGRMLQPPALDPVGCYEAKVEDGDVYVRPKERPEPEPITETGGQTFLIVGAGAAGNAAAETLRREGFAGRILLLTAEPDRPYDRPNLSKEFLAGKADPDWIPLRPEPFYADHKIELLTDRRVTGVDTKARTVSTENGDSLDYDKLLLATGGVPRPLPAPGTDLDGFFLLRSKADAEAIVAALNGAEKAVVIGASFIGLEAASSLRERGLEVDVAAPEEVLMEPVFGKRVGRWLQSLHEENGVSFHLDRTVKAISGGGSVKSVTLSDDASLAADLVVAGLGVTPAVGYLDGSGLVEDGAVPVNERLQTGETDVFAAGDIAAVPDPRLGRRIRIEHWAVAERQGQHAARAMLGASDPYTEPPFFWTKQCGKSVDYVGAAPDFDVVAYRGSVEDGDFLAGYYRDGTLLAAAAVGRNVEFIALGRLIHEGKTPSLEQFEDEEVELPGLLD
jgi:NADPH-dependent 2,4-dienoyl-CoA reductase/sulfur reductase-like enzyme/nitrite reductase/ring-hydroxylating ferredoxin subunit